MGDGPHHERARDVEAGDTILIGGRWCAVRNQRTSEIGTVIAFRHCGPNVLLPPNRVVKVDDGWW